MRETLKNRVVRELKRSRDEHMDYAERVACSLHGTTEEVALETQRAEFLDMLIEEMEYGPIEKGAK